MASTFPGSADNIANNVTNSTPEVDTHPNLHNKLADAVNAVELALLPGGTMNLAAHIAAADPHAVYLTQTEGDARYSALGAGTVPDGSITSAKIADGTIVAGDIADGAITSAKILDGTIDTADLKDGAVTSAKILDGTIATVDLANGAVTNAKLAADTARDNLLTNGGFEVWQRGNGPFTAPFAYCADRWQILASAGTASVIPNAGAHDVGSFRAAQITTTAPSTGALGNGLYQVVDPAENPAMLGRTMTVSVRVVCSQANSVRVSLSPDKAGGGSFGHSAYHSGGGGWETLSVSLAVGSAAAGLTIWITGQVAGTWYADNAMLVVGSVAADYAPLHPADDLARCLRYYEVLGGYGGALLRWWQAPAAGTEASPFLYGVKKAVTPTVTKTGTWAVSNCSQPAVGSPTVQGFSFSTGSTAGGSAYYQCSDATTFISIEGNP